MGQMAAAAAAAAVDTGVGGKRRKPNEDSDAKKQTDSETIAELKRELEKSERLIAGLRRVREALNDWVHSCSHAYIEDALLKAKACRTCFKVEEEVGQICVRCYRCRAECCTGRANGCEPRPGDDEETE